MSLSRLTFTNTFTDIFFYIDKTTLSYAALYGIREDLDLTGSQYSWLSSIFYFGFLFWAFPTNFLMQKFPLGKYLGFNIMMWGVFLMLQAACTSFASLAALRFLSGAAEACSDPAFMLITQMWYTRRQQPLRIGLWYLGNGIGISTGSLLGYVLDLWLLPPFEFEHFNFTLIFFASLASVSNDGLQVCNRSH